MKMRGRPRYPETLTPRQQEVLALVRQGLTNEEIAKRLGISLDGAKWHVSEILMRLGVESRHEAALWSPEPQRSRFAVLLAPFAAMKTHRLGVAGHAIGGAIAGVAIIAVALLAWGVRSTAGDQAADSAASNGNEIVFTTQTGETSSLGRTAPLWNVMTYDTTQHRVVHSFEVGGKGDFPTQAVVAGSKIIVNLETRIVEYDVDGANARELRHARDGGRFFGIGASPDGTLLAITEQTRAQFDASAAANPSATALPYSAITEILVINLPSGADLLSVEGGDPGLTGYLGQPALIQWRDDGRGFIVEGYTYSDGGGSFATIMLDRTVVVHDGAWMGTLISPNARFSIDNTRALTCGLGGVALRHTMPLRDSTKTASSAPLRIAY